MTFLGLTIYNWMVIAGVPIIYTLHWAIKRRIKDEIKIEVLDKLRPEVQQMMNGKFDRKIGSILDGHAQQYTALAKSVESLAICVEGLTKTVDALEKRSTELGKDIRELRNVVIKV